ncbi:MAG: hypothetical protein V3S41_03610, partial [Spirochaetia bacterium]
MIRLGRVRVRVRAPHRRQLIALLVVITVLVGVVSGQDSAGTDAGDQIGSVFAPFVSRLRLSTRDPEVRLTWEDSEDVEG